MERLSFALQHLDQGATNLVVTGIAIMQHIRLISDDNQKRVKQVLQKKQIGLKKRIQYVYHRQLEYFHEKNVLEP